MKVEVNSQALADAVAWTTRVIDARPATPILAGIRLEAIDGTLQLSAFNYAISARHHIEAGVDEAGSVLVLGKLLADITKSLPAAKTYLSTDGSTMTITSGKSTFTMQLMPESEYPDLPVVPTKLGQVDSPTFAQAVNQASVAVSREENRPVLTGIRNSLIVSAFSAAFSVYFSALTAYGIYAYNFRFKKAAFAIILLIMTMPTQVSALGFLQLITKMGLKNSFIPLIVPSIAAPTVFFFMKQYLDASLPMEIVEAARIDGAGEFYTFNKIVLPIMKPALAVQAIFSFVASWNNYFIPALVLDSADKKTLPILIAQLRSADFLKFDMGKVYMMVAIAILPVIVVYLLLSKFIVRGIALGGVKG